jgi:hypothetical protein
LTAGLSSFVLICFRLKRYPRFLHCVAYDRDGVRRKTIIVPLMWSYEGACQATRLPIAKSAINAISKVLRHASREGGQERRADGDTQRVETHEQSGRRKIDAAKTASAMVVCQEAKADRRSVPALLLQKN